jgi:hypothetical protein
MTENTSTEKPNNLFPLTPSQLIKLIDYYTSTLDYKGNPKPMVAALVWGAPGIGKSALGKNIADSRNSRLVPLILSQSDPVDIKGLPIRTDDNQVIWVASSFLPQEHIIYNPDKTTHTVSFKHAIGVAVYLFDEDGVEVYRHNDPVLDDLDELGIGTTTISRIGPNWTIELSSVPMVSVTMHIEEKALLFLDEISTAEPAVQNAGLQLVLDRRVGEYTLPHSTPILSAGNRESDGAFVQGLSHPLANRFAHLTLIPDVADFIEWGMMSGRLSAEIMGFAKAYPDCLSSYDPDTLVNGNYGFSTPRTLTMLSDQYAPIEFFESLSAASAENKPLEARHMQMAMIAGLIGEAEALRFTSYLDVMYSLPSAEDIINGTETELGKVERSKSFGLLFSLVQNLKEYHSKYYDDNKGRDEQSSTWTNARDNIIDFITTNYEREAGTWAGTVIFQQMNLTSKSLRSDAMMRFAAKNVEVMKRIGSVKR